MDDALSGRDGFEEMGWFSDSFGSRQRRKRRS